MEDQCIQAVQDNSLAQQSPSGHSRVGPFHLSTALLFNTKPEDVLDRGDDPRPKRDLVMAASPTQLSLSNRYAALSADDYPFLRAPDTASASPPSLGQETAPADIAAVPPPAANSTTAADHPTAVSQRSPSLAVNPSTWHRILREVVLWCSSGTLRQEPAGNHHSSSDALRTVIKLPGDSPWTEPRSSCSPVQSPSKPLPSPGAIGAAAPSPPPATGRAPPPVVSTEAPVKSKLL